MKDELDQGPVINIPDTIIYKYRQPAFWYFTASNGQVKRKSKYNLLNAKIEETFTRNKRGCDIVAYYLTRGAQPSDVTIEYFDKAGFHDFLYKREKNENGIVQRFIEPKGTQNAMIRAIWSPKVCLLERRINVHNLQDTRRFSMYDRAITYEGPDVNSRAAPVRGSILPSQVQRTCQALVNHVAEVSFQKHRIKRLAGNFKVDPKDRVWFLWATSLRIEHTGELSPRSHKRLLKEGITPGAPVNIDALLSIPSTVRITTSIPKPGQPPISTTGNTLFDCPSCGRSVQPDFCHKVSYKTIVEHFNQLLSIMGAGSFGQSRGSGSSMHMDALPADGLAWPPDPEVVAALGGVGLGGALGPLGKTHGGGGHHHHHGPHVPSEEDLVIPPVLRIAHPNMAVAEYRRYRRDPLFLYKSTMICEDCWLVYAETSGASSTSLGGSGGVSSMLSSLSMSRSMDSRRLSPLSRRGGRGSGHGQSRRERESAAAEKAAAAAARRKRQKARRSRSRASMEGSENGRLGQLMTPGPGIPPRITLDDLGPDGLNMSGVGGSSVLEQIARQGQSSMNGMSGGMGQSRGSSMLSSAGSMMQDVGAPPPQGVQAVPEAFRQTLQEREDAFFRELYQNPNLQRGHPLSHMVVGAAKIRAHQQQMAEFQQNLGAEITGGMQQSAPPPQVSAPVASPSSPKTAERIAASPYARLQMLSGKLPPGSEPERKNKKGAGSKQRKKKSKQAREREAMQRGTGPGGLDDAGTGSRLGGGGGGGGGGHHMVEEAHLGYVTEEDMSASASAHRDFLLQTLRNVRDQLSNPSPLIIAGMDEETDGLTSGGSVGGGGSSYLSPDEMMGGGGGGNSITLPQVEETSSAFDGQGSRTDVRFLFDLVDPGHQGQLSKMEVLRSISSVQRVRDLVENAPSLAGLLEPATWADDFMAMGTETDGTVTMQELEQFAMQMS